MPLVTQTFFSCVLVQCGQGVYVTRSCFLLVFLLFFFSSSFTSTPHTHPSSYTLVYPSLSEQALRHRKIEDKKYRHELSPALSTKLSHCHTREFALHRRQRRIRGKQQN